MAAVLGCAPVFWLAGKLQAMIAKQMAKAERVIRFLSIFILLVLLFDTIILQLVSEFNRTKDGGSIIPWIVCLLYLS